MATALFQSARPSRGETLDRFTHAWPWRLFQSSRPLRGETLLVVHVSPPLLISIHSPLTGRDSSSHVISRFAYAISIHSPLAGRDSKKSQNTSCKNHSFCTTHILADSKIGPIKKKNELCLGGNGHASGANPPGIWCALAVRIKGLVVHPSKGRAIHHSALLCCDNDCPAHRSERCRALRPFRSGLDA